LTVSFLERVLAIRTERYQLQIDHSTRTAIPVEGIHHLTSQLHFRADLAVERGAHHIWPQIWQLSLIASPVGVAIVPGSLLYCIYCFRSLLLRYIHHIPKLVFPRGVLSTTIGDTWGRNNYLWFKMIGLDLPKVEMKYFQQFLAHYTILKGPT
jgi:hypothetical protein